jgi:hypothetical protein
MSSFKPLTAARKAASASYGMASQLASTHYRGPDASSGEDSLLLNSAQSSQLATNAFSVCLNKDVHVEPGCRSLGSLTKWPERRFRPRTHALCRDSAPKDKKTFDSRPVTPLLRFGWQCLLIWDSLQSDCAFILARAVQAAVSIGSAVPNSYERRKKRCQKKGAFWWLIERS